MTSFDYVVLGVLGLSILISVVRGGVREIISLAAWILAFILARTYTTDLAAHLPKDIPTTEMRYLAAFIGIFLGVWLLSAIIRITFSHFIQASGLTGVDRLVGAVFGALRGSLIVISLVLLSGLTQLPTTLMWRNAMFSPICEATAQALLPLLPEELAQRIHY